MGFQHSSYEGEEDELSLETLKAAKSSSWQGEIHSWALLLFSEIPIQSPGGFILCESAIPKALHNNSQNQNVTAQRQLWSRRDWGVHTGKLWERHSKGKSFLRMFAIGNSGVLKGQCWLTSNNHSKQPKFGFFPAVMQAGIPGLVLRGSWNTRTDTQRNRKMWKCRGGTPEEAGPGCSCQSFGVWQCSKLG